MNAGAVWHRRAVRQAKDAIGLIDDIVALLNVIAGGELSDTSRYRWRRYWSLGLDIISDGPFDDHLVMRRMLDFEKVAESMVP